MEVTKIYLNFPKKRYARLRAWAKVILEDSLIVTDIALMEKKNPDGTFYRYLVFPQKTLPQRKQDEKPKVVSVANPITNEYRMYLTEMILQAYDACDTKPVFDEE